MLRKAAVPASKTCGSTACSVGSPSGSKLGVWKAHAEFFPLWSRCVSHLMARILRVVWDVVQSYPWLDATYWTCKISEVSQGFSAKYWACGNSVDFLLRCCCIYCLDTSECVPVCFAYRILSCIDKWIKQFVTILIVNCLLQLILSKYLFST